MSEISGGAEGKSVALVAAWIELYSNALPVGPETCSQPCTYKDSTQHPFKLLALTITTLPLSMSTL